MSAGVDRGLTRPPDHVLAEHARAGDTGAFEALVRRYRQPMYNLALRITGSAADAEDVTQEAFVLAWRRLPAFRGDSAFATWLYRIVTNRALSALRRRRPVAPLAGEDPPAAAYRGPAGQVEQDALLAALVAAVAELPVELRVAWLLRESQQCSYEEVAQIVQVPVSTVRGRIARARAALAAALAGWQ